MSYSTTSAPNTSTATVKKLTQKFRFKIPSNVQEKIDTICSQISNIEWSGVLFYKIEGSLKDISNLVITPVDILLLDIGNSGATDYSYDEDLSKYVTSNPSLLEEGVYIGHIHSHHTMSTFFSSVDLAELNSSAPLHNVFVSLIVNNEGTYSVGLSTKGIYKANITTTQEIQFTDFTGNLLDFDPSSTPKVVEEETIFQVFGTVDPPEENSESIFSKIRKRILDLKSKKQVVTSKQNYSGYSGYPGYSLYPNPDYGKSNIFNVAETGIASNEKKDTLKKPLIESPSPKIKHFTQNFSVSNNFKDDFEEALSDNELISCILKLSIVPSEIDLISFTRSLSKEDSVRYYTHLSDILEMICESSYSYSYSKFYVQLERIITRLDSLTYNSTLEDIIKLLTIYTDNLLVYIDEEFEDEDYPEQQNLNSSGTDAAALVADLQVAVDKKQKRMKFKKSNKKNTSKK